MVDYRPDHKGTGELLVAPEMHRLVAAGAEAGREYAVSISPDREPYSEGYIASFEVETGRTDTIARSRRATAIVRNTAPYAAVVEWQWDHHVLARTADFIESWAS